MPRTDFVELQHNDGLQPIAAQKLNYNFRRIAALLDSKDFVTDGRSNANSETAGKARKEAGDAQETADRALSLIPDPSDALPLMDGSAAAGLSGDYSRGDHVHPTDTSRAPVNHASTENTYGVGNGTKFGHLRLSDSTSGTASTSGGYAATPKAVKDALDAAKNYADSVATPGAQANQNAFGYVRIDSTDLEADQTRDMFTILAGANIQLTPNVTTDSVTISATDTTYDTTQFYWVRGETSIIQANDNLDDYETPGMYACDSAAIAATLTNCPTDSAFRLEVGNFFYGTARTYQRLFLVQTGREFFRCENSNADGGGWTGTKWYELGHPCVEDASSNKFLATPSSSTGRPSFRSIVKADLPTIAKADLPTGLFEDIDDTVDIPAGADLDNYTTPGTYACTNGDRAAGLSNIPTGLSTAFRMVVGKSFGSRSAAYIFQEITLYYNGRVYRRACNGQSVWSGWYQETIIALPTTTGNRVLATPDGSAGYPGFRALAADDIPNLNASKITAGTLDLVRLPEHNPTSLPSTADLDDYTTPGTYYCGTSTYPATMSNCPISSGFFFLDVRRAGGTTTESRIQTLVTMGTGQTYRRRKASSSAAWGSWYYAAPTSDGTNGANKFLATPITAVNPGYPDYRYIGLADILGALTPQAYNVKSLITPNSAYVSSIDAATLYVSGFTAQLFVEFTQSTPMAVNAECQLFTLDSSIRPVDRAVAGLGSLAVHGLVMGNGKCYARPSAAQIAASTAKRFYSTYILASAYTG